jgi:LmbE family N-acetylglucosaminyl deacetylase
MTRTCGPLVVKEPLVHSDLTTLRSTGQPIVGPVTAPDHSTVYLSAPRRVLGVWAHPDDEAYLSAGLMDRVVRAGGHVTVVALSDGEAGFPDDDGRSIGVRRTLRRTELRAALSQIGVADVRFLGLPDGGVDDAEPAPIIDALAGILAEVRPDVTVTFGPDGITGHVDHVACWRLATAAWCRTTQGQLWYAAKTARWLDRWRALHDRIGLWMTEPPTGLSESDVLTCVQLDTAELDRKRAVLDGHASQTAGVVTVFGEDDYRRWIGEETFRLPTAAERADAGAQRAFARSAVA